MPCSILAFIITDGTQERQFLSVFFEIPLSLKKIAENCKFYLQKWKNPFILKDQKNKYVGGGS